MNYSNYIYITTMVENVISRLHFAIERLSNIRKSEETRKFDQAKMIYHEFKQSRKYLKVVRSDIRKKVSQINNSYKGGFWPQSTANITHIHYLKDVLSIINQFGILLFITNRISECMLDPLEHILKSGELLNAPKLKATFLLYETFTWPSYESVYEAFTRDLSCEVDLVYIPFRNKNPNNIDWFFKYKDMNLPVVNWEDYNISEASPDIVFYVKPYNSIPDQFFIDQVEKVVKRCVYIPYFVNWMERKNIDFLIKYHFQMPLLEKAWKIFDAPTYIKDYHAHYGDRNGDNVETVGHPRFDCIKKSSDFKSTVPLEWKTKIQDKIVFLWNTHAPMTISDNDLSDWSTYEIIGEKMIEYFAHNEDAVLLWRPHPNFFPALLNSRKISINEIEQLRNMFEANDHLVLDELADYRYAFAVSDALISDASSFLVEYIFTDNPILYTYRSHLLNIVNGSLLPAYDLASNWNDVKDFIERTKRGEDLNKNARTKIKKVELSFDEEFSVGEAIKKICLEGIAHEEKYSPAWEQEAKKTN